MADMTREEAALVRLRLIAQRAFEAAIENKHGKGEEAQKDLDAIDFAIATMQSKTALRGWVRTAERLPTGADANKNLCVLAMVARDRQIRVVRYEELYAKEFGGAYYFSHWMKLPEVEG